MPSKTKKNQKSKSTDESLAQHMDHESKSSMSSRLSRSAKSQSLSIRNLSREINLQLSGDIDEILITSPVDVHAPIGPSFPLERCSLPETSVDITQMLLHSSASSIEASTPIHPKSIQGSASQHKNESSLKLGTEKPFEPIRKSSHAHAEEELPNLLDIGLSLSSCSENIFAEQAHTMPPPLCHEDTRPVQITAPEMHAKCRSLEHVSEPSAIPEITCYADPDDLDEEVIAEEKSKKHRQEQEKEAPASEAKPCRTLDATANRVPSAHSLLLTQSQSYPYAGVVKPHIEVGPLSAQPSFMTTRRRQNPLGYHHGPSLTIQTPDFYPVSMSSSLSPLSAEASTPLSLDSSSRRSTLATGKLSSYFFGKKSEKESLLPFRRSQSLVMGLGEYVAPLLSDKDSVQQPSCDHKASLSLEPATPLPVKTTIDAKQSVIAEFNERERDFGHHLKLLKSFIMSVEIADRDKKILAAGLQDLIHLSDKLSHGLSSFLDNYDPTNSNVGTLFLASQREFEIYRSYIQNYNSVTNRNEFLENESLIYRNAIDAFKRDETVNKNRHDMSAFFMLPIQQLTRYTIFFQKIHSLQMNSAACITLIALIKHCRAEDKDWESICAASAFLKTFTNEMNSLRARDESQTRIFSIMKDVKDCPADMVSDKRLWIKELDAIQYASFDRKPRRVRIYIFSDMILVARVEYKDQSSDMKKAEKEGRLMAPFRKSKPLLTFWYSVSRSGLCQVLSENLVIEDSKSSYKDSPKPSCQLQLGFDRIHMKVNEALHRHGGKSRGPLASSTSSPSSLGRTLSTKKKLFGFGPRISPNKPASHMGSEAYAAGKVDFQASTMSIRTRSNFSVMTKYQDSMISSFQSSTDNTSRLGSFLPNSPMSSHDGSQMDRVDFRIKEPKDRDEVYHELYGRINELLMNASPADEHTDESFLADRIEDDSPVALLKDRPSPLFGTESQTLEIQSSA